jgi:hypothetical protein
MNLNTSAEPYLMLMARSSIGWNNILNHILLRGLLTFTTDATHFNLIDAALDIGRISRSCTALAPEWTATL